MLMSNENPDAYGTYHSWEGYSTLELSTGLQKSMPDFLDQIREVRFESNRGTKCWILEATGAGIEIHVKWKMANDKTRFGGGLIDKTRGRLRGIFGRLLHENRKIVKRIYDGQQHL